MSKFIDLTGQKFGRLTVTELSSSGGCRKTSWKCICECGNTKTVSGYSLRSRRTRSCGCLKIEMLRIIDMPGKKFGRWTVIGLYGKDKSGNLSWLCRCECGKEKNISGYSLRNGNTKSCGCLGIVMVGKKFGRLTVIERSGSNSNLQAVWLCRCECGKEKNISGYSLRNGNTKSCGCLIVEINSLPHGEASFNSLYRGYKKSAKVRLMEFSLDKEKHFRPLISSNCYWCGSPPAERPHIYRGRSLYNGNLAMNGIDRINNFLGYTPSNCVSCCRRCNYMKSNLTEEEFREHIIKIYNKLNLQVNNNVIC